jgi:hypothetical protein
MVRGRETPPVCISARRSWLLVGAQVRIAGLGAPDAAIFPNSPQAVVAPSRDLYT